MKKGNVTLFRVETFKKNDELDLKTSLYYCNKAT